MTINSDLIIDSILKGFALYSILYILFQHKLLNWKNEVVLNLDKISCILFSIAGLLFLAKWSFSIYDSYAYTADSEQHSEFMKRAMGRYLFYFIMIPIIYTIATQLMWIKKIRISKIARISIAIAMLLNYERLVMIFTLIQRGDLPSRWTSSFGYILKNWATYFTLFGLIVGVTYLIFFRLIKQKKID